MANTINSGKIIGNPLNGLCERVCINVRKVHDGCISRIQNEQFTSVPLSNVSPANFTLSLNFVEVVSYGNIQITNLSLTQIADDRARVRYNVVLPLVVRFTDASGVPFTANAEITLSRDAVLNLPTDGADYSIEATGKLLGRVGRINDTATLVDFTCCIAIITRVITKADVVIPTYGLCVYPDCRDYEDDACSIIFNTPPFN